MSHSQLNKLWKQFVSQSKENLGILRKANAFMKEVDAYIMWSTWYNAVLNGLYSLGVFTLVGYTAQTAINSFASEKHFTPGLFALCVAGFVLYKFGQLIVDSIQKYRNTSFDAKIEAVFEKKVLEHSMGLDMGRLTDADFKNNNRFGRQCHSIQKVFEYQTGLLSAIVGTVASFAVVAVIKWPILVLGVLPSIPEAILLFVFNKKRREQRDNMYLLYMRKDSYFTALKDPETLIQAKLFKFVPFLYEKFVDCSSKAREGYVNLSKTEVYWKSIIGFSKASLNCVILVYLGKGCLDGTVTFAHLLMVIGSLETFSMSVSKISGNFLYFQEHAKDYLEFEKLMNIKPLIDETKAKNIVIGDIPTLTLEHVTFSYPRNPDHIVLHNCNLVIRPEEKVAIVGQNGAGKSTILNLLAKVYLPNEGRVLINDFSIEEIKQDSWINHLVYIIQSSRINDLPLKEALAGSTNPDMDRLMQAAKLAGAHDLIVSREKKYDMQLRSHWEEEGEEFSKGEYQKLALVSAFLPIVKPRCVCWILR